MLFSQLSLAQLLSHVQLFVTPWTPAPQASLSCPLSHWCHPTITSSVVSVSSHLQSSPVSGSFPVSWFFTSCGQSVGASALASVLPMNIQDWFSLGFTGWISLQSSPTPQFKSINFWNSAFFIVQLSYSYMITGKTIALTRQTFVGKVMSLLFNVYQYTLGADKCCLIPFTWGT